MEKLTAIIPTSNEAHNIEEVLQTVAFADEIIVVDSHSTDTTVELAKKHTDRVLTHHFETHAKQKNWAIQQASNEWILLVDADERITPELQKEIIDILSQAKDNVAYWIYRKNKFLDSTLKYSGIQGDKCIRLFRKSKCRYEEKYVHEEIISTGKVGYLKHRMRHNTYRDLNLFYNKLNYYADLQAQDYLKKTKRVNAYHLWLKPNFRFFKHYIIGRGFLDGFPGYVYAITQKHAVKMRYIKLKMLQKQID